MVIRKHSLRLFLILFLCLTATTAFADTIVVSTSGELAAAVGAAAEGDIIELVPGSYHWANGVKVDVGLTVRGQSGDPVDVLIYLDYLNQGIVDSAGFQGTQVLRWEGLTFRQFSASVNLIGLDTDLELVRCVFDENTTELDLVVGNASLLAEDCLFKGNQAGALVLGSGATTLSGCRFQDNSGSYALVGQEFGSLTLSRCSWKGNTGTMVMTAPVAVVADHCLITGNSGQCGIDLQFSVQLEMSDCTIQDNQFYDGGLYLGGLSQASLTQCDIIHNGNYDGKILACQDVLFTCCEVAMEDWFIVGSTYILDNEDCAVGNSPVTLDRIKVLYR
jgi:hypothetical protein